MEKFLENQRYQLCLFFYVGLLVFLGRQFYGLPNFDDCYYAQKAKELLKTGDFWTMRFNGAPTFENVPFPMWMTALSYKIFGVSSFAAVFFPSLFSTLTIITTYKITILLFKDNWTAFLAAFILIFPGYFFDASRRGMVDSTLTFFITSALYTFLKGLEKPEFFILSGFFNGLAILTKSVLGIFPVFITFSFLFFTGQHRIIFSRYYLGGIFLCLSLSGSWYLINFSRYGTTFTETHFGWLIVKRAFNNLSHQSDSFFFLGYARDLLGNHWPWIPVVFIGILKGLKEVFTKKTPSLIFILSWILIIFVIMSSSRTQQSWYILSTFPGMAILTAFTIRSWVKERSKRLNILKYMVYIILILPLFINSTNFQIKSSVMLSENNGELRHLAKFINLNTKEGTDLINYKMAAWYPRNVMMFYGNRFLTDPITDSQKLIQEIKETKNKRALAYKRDFNAMKKELRDKFYIIVAGEEFVFFTLKEYQKEIRYDIEGIVLPK